jgi:HAD superfamily hydrolase (TIGR01509 family)
MTVNFDWIHDFQLFLFDMDGLLVNTEKLHFLAYKRLCSRYGHELPWDFREYCAVAHGSAEGLKEQILGLFPAMAAKSWELLYQEKKALYLRILNDEGSQMMPGVSELLYALAKAQIPRCVVTHSPKEQVLLIRKQNSVLNTIPQWFSRGDYLKPKPDPECYVKAIQKFSMPGDRAIGFEDSLKGMRALQGSSAVPVLICPHWHPAKVVAQKEAVLHFGNFTELSPRKLAACARDHVPI